MDKADHRLTASWGSSGEAKAYREKQKALILQGKFHDAMLMDIYDIRSKFGDKYDFAILQAKTYWRNKLRGLELDYCIPKQDQ
jgi:filamentous hemagglutinin